MWKFQRDWKLSAADLWVPRLRRNQQTLRGTFHSQLLLPDKGKNQLTKRGSPESQPTTLRHLWGTGRNALSARGGWRVWGAQSASLFFPRTTCRSRAPPPTATTGTAGWSWWTPSVRKRCSWDTSKSLKYDPTAAPSLQFHLYRLQIINKYIYIINITFV